MADLNLVDAGFAKPVHGFSTTRKGGFSRQPFDSLNLGMSCGDDPQAVSQNRSRLREQLPAEPCWLQQVHASTVIHLDDWQADIQADAAWTDRPNQVAAILTADCLPILVASEDGSCVAAIHAGWRGLVSGVIEHTIQAMAQSSGHLLAWIGPSIRQPAYEVGDEVRMAFADYASAFAENVRGRWQADLQAIARHKLIQTGVKQVRDSGYCTHQDGARFYSHRRDGRSGRQASLIWFE